MARPLCALALLASCAPSPGWEAIRAELSVVRGELAEAHHTVARLHADATAVRRARAVLAEAILPFEDAFPDERALRPAVLQPGSRYAIDAQTRDAWLDPERIGRRGYPRPVVLHGEAGYRLAHVYPTSLPARLGLRTGDVVLAINGRPLGELTDAAAARDLFADARQLRLRVFRPFPETRDRRVFTLTWDVVDEVPVHGPVRPEERP